MNFVVLPPETNSAAMYGGAGSGPMLEAAAAWDGLASGLGSAASSFNSVTSGFAFESAFAATVHPMSVAANRNSFLQAVMSNWFGLNAPAIAELEAEYETMWARDVGASAAAQQLTTLQIDEAILSTPFNFGWPNIGFFNAGAFNVGDFNVGIGNYGLANIGIGNVGNNNIGEFLTGKGQIGIGPMSTTSM